MAHGKRPPGPSTKTPGHMTDSSQPQALLDGGGRSFVLGLDPIHAAIHQAARIEQMLREKATLGPAAAIIEFDPEEIADFAEYAIFHLSAQLTAGVGNMKSRTQGYGPIYLQTGPRKGNIFQIGNTAAGPSIRILPLN